MIKQPPYLKKGDKIAIVSPAKKLKQPIDHAIALLESWGLEVVLGKSVYDGYDQFAGSDAARAEDLQTFIDDKDVKAIIAARGGYGTVRIIDALDFTAFQRHPKWLIGFSDITVLLSHLFAAEQIQSIHGQMPGVFESGTPDSIETLRKALFGEDNIYTYTSEHLNRIGSAEGILVGGNLSILLSVEGSVSAIDFKDKILFLEDVGEQEYAIDRMLRMFKRAGKLAQLKGLIIGAFNAIEPEEIPFGKSADAVIEEIVAEYDYPVCYNFPVGHIEDNKAMVLGKLAYLQVDQNRVTFKQKG